MSWDTVWQAPAGLTKTAPSAMRPGLGRALPSMWTVHQGVEGAAESGDPAEVEAEEAGETGMAAVSGMAAL
ncbi:hypothetical protein CT3_16670 [Comamonas terrigena NBRC 13299]|nr:hypothetical protein CT3_16670 [Comamonas terrigena NBRC 13299]